MNQQGAQKLFHANEGGQELTRFTILGLTGRIVRLDNQVLWELPVVTSANLVYMLHCAYDFLAERRSTVRCDLVVRNLKVATETMSPRARDNQTWPSQSIQALGLAHLILRKRHLCLIHAVHDDAENPCTRNRENQRMCQ